MRFSILVPIYNAEKYIDECLASVFRQTCQDFEVILVDDGSFDRTPELCDSYYEKYPEQVRVIHQENSGQLVARYNAALVASGDYCVFLDVDDFLTEDALSVLSEEIEKHRHPDMVMYPYYEEENGQSKVVWQITEGDIFYGKEEIIQLRGLFFLRKLPFTLWTKAVKREIVIKSVSHMERFSFLRFSEDRLQVLWILDKIESAVYIDRPLYRHRFVEGSISRIYSAEQLEKRNETVIYDEEKKLLQKWNLDSPSHRLLLKEYFAYRVVKTFSLFFMNVKKNERNTILYYPWKNFILRDITLDDVANFSYLKEIHRKLFIWIASKDYNKLRYFFFKRKIYLALRDFKRSIIPKKAAAG